MTLQWTSICVLLIHCYCQLLLPEYHPESSFTGCKSWGCSAIQGLPAPRKALPISSFSNTCLWNTADLGCRLTSPTDDRAYAIFPCFKGIFKWELVDNLRIWNNAEEDGICDWVTHLITELCGTHSKWWWLPTLWLAHFSRFNTANFSFTQSYLNRERNGKDE